MTKDEKLQHFYDVTIENANKQRKKIIDDYKEDLEKEFKRYEEDKALRTRNEIESRSALIKRNINREFSAESLEIKHSISEKQEELKESLFVEVIEKLNDFKNKPDYFEYLIGLINDAKSFAGNDDLWVFIDKSDERFKDELQKKTGLIIDISPEDLGGGIQARINSRNIFIDESFNSAIEEEKENYNFEGDQNS